MSQESLCNFALNSYQLISGFVVNNELFFFFSKLMNAVINESLHKVLPAQCSIAMHALHFKEFFLYSDGSHIESTPAHVDYESVPIFLDLVLIINPKSNRL